MNSSGIVSKYPLDIELASDPLVEAWLEIRWRLQPTGQPGLLRDPNFAFALGVFFQKIRDQFGFRKDLDASNAPEELFPYVARHQFRPAEGKGPILQLGPGVATVNFTEDYTWERFRDQVLYLRNELIEAYGEDNIDFTRVNLRYRNAEQFDYISHNLLEFLDQNLNTSVQLPSHIPGTAESSPGPSRAIIELTYNLDEAIGKGFLKFATATAREQGLLDAQAIERKILVWELAILSEKVKSFDPKNVEVFGDWLDSAHNVIHDWFFSLVEGELRSSYEGEGGQ
jgi:uncharacterized protein (TIGR04255 family)